MYYNERGDSWRLEETKETTETNGDALLPSIYNYVYSFRCTKYLLLFIII